MQTIRSANVTEILRFALDDKNKGEKNFSVKG